MKPRYLAIGTGLCLLLTITLLVVLPSQIHALPANDVEVWWIDENGYEVGHLVRTCSGAHFMEGVQSDRYLTHSESCSTGTGSTTCYVNQVQVSCSSEGFIALCVMLGGVC